MVHDACSKCQDDDKDVQDSDFESGVYRPPDGGWGWMVVFSSFMCVFTMDGIANTFGILRPALIEHFDSDDATISWVGSLLCGLYMLSGPFVGGLVSKFGCRPICMMGAILSASAFVVSTFSTSVGILMITFGVLGGIGFGLIYIPAIVSVGFYFESKRALATGVAVCGSGVGTFTFAPFATFLLGAHGWKLYAG